MVNAMRFCPTKAVHSDYLLRGHKRRRRRSTVNKALKFKPSKNQWPVWGGALLCSLLLDVANPSAVIDEEHGDHQRISISHLTPNNSHLTPPNKQS
jgi:hypothetical protein